MSRKGGLSLPHKRKEVSQDRLKQLVSELREMATSRHAPLPSEPDYFTNEKTLTRFIKARKYVLKDAYKQLAAAIEWRREYRPNQVECIWCAEQPGYHGIRQVGFDSEQRTVMYACFAQCHTNKNTAEDVIAHVLYLVENAIRCSEALADELVIVVDCTGFSLPCCNPKIGKQFVQTFANNYPEHLNRFYLINHNPILQGVWKTIKVFVDPNTAKKVKLVKKERLESIFEERFGTELAAWLREEIRLNRTSISEAQLRFWQAPQDPGVHDPRGAPSYVRKYIEPLEQRRKQIPNELLKLSVLGRNVHMPHPNIINELNGQLKDYKLVGSRNQKQNLTKEELEEYGVCLTNQMSCDDDDDDSTSTGTSPNSRNSP
ncbi:unnamed protein product [Dicrocoelium dendriticum]|nr:unnamed protein product [Dicrocoelium dendriticum]